MSGGGSSPRPRRTAWRSSPYTVAVPLLVIAEALSLRSVIPGVAGLLLGAVLTAADVRWYRESLVVDYRVVVLAVVLALFAAAAFLPARTWIGRTLER